MKKKSSSIIKEPPMRWANSRMDESKKNAPKKQVKASQHYRPGNR